MADMGRNNAKAKLAAGEVVTALAGVDDLPLDGGASGLDHPAGRPRDLWPDAVAGNERDGVVHLRG